MKISCEALDAVLEHARASSPDECCGILLGRPQDGDAVVAALKARNAEQGDPRHAYVLGHEAHCQAVRMEIAGDARIVGYYHSHPDGPARPSSTDARQAVPGVLYLIAGGRDGRLEQAAWRWTGREFAAEAINVCSNDDTHASLRPNSAVRRYDSVADLIAGPENPTPLVRLNRVVPASALQVYVKLEWFNPFGSIKDRTALYLLNGLRERGELEGKQIVEPTSGNTGIALAALAALLRVKCTVTIPEGVPDEKKVLLRMLGAEVWPTPDDLCPVNHPKDGAIALARSFVEGEATRDRYVMPNQYENADNVKAHYETTGPEIWRQTEGRVTHFLAGFGTCGTITGVGRFLKEQNPKIKVIAIEPQKGHRIPGLKNMRESKQPGILDRSVIDEVVQVDDAPAYAMTKRLFREEALIVGPSTGAIVHAAAQIAAGSEGVAVAISPDSGFKYASFFADILGDEGKPA